MNETYLTIRHITTIAREQSKTAVYDIVVEEPGKRYEVRLLEGDCLEIPDGFTLTGTFHGNNDRIAYVEPA